MGVHLNRFEKKLLFVKLFKNFILDFIRRWTITIFLTRLWETDDYGYTVDITVTRNIFCHKTLKQGPGTCMETVLMIANKDLTIINEIMNKYNVENPKKY
ncbi:hypothetical protein RIR_jg36592.t1 [Rhizophagus irregularis DAOM 181602=DAOM 197198]|nr:hypothetical protein RIR_jg36592.t1 [Rhizophagus irregularis DAOM 181602=DAOM 197198]